MLFELDDFAKGKDIEDVALICCYTYFGDAN